MHLAAHIQEPSTIAYASLSDAWTVHDGELFSQTQGDEKSSKIWGEKNDLLRQIIEANDATEIKAISSFERFFAVCRVCTVVCHVSQW